MPSTLQHRKRLVLPNIMIDPVLQLTRSHEQIDVKDLSITTGDRELLAHADLKLRENVHYVLVGRNGTGKSSENHFAVHPIFPNFNLCIGGQPFFEPWAKVAFQACHGAYASSFSDSQV